MNYALYAIAGMMVLGILLTIAAVGKPRKPTTPGMAAIVTFVNAGYVVILVLAGMRL